MRKLICTAMVLMLLFTAAVQCAAAEEYGSVRVTLAREEDRTYYGTVTLYRVGFPVSGGFRLGSGYGGGFTEEKDALSPALAQWLADQVGTADGFRVVDSEGCAFFEGLEEGLYLVVQTDPAEGFYPFLPFLVQIPYKGQWDILAFPKMESAPVVIPQTGDPFPLSAYMMVSAISAAGLVVLVRRRRKM